jgi:hypothetical protein
MSSYPKRLMITSFPRLLSLMLEEIRTIAPVSQPSQSSLLEVLLVEVGEVTALFAVTLVLAAPLVIVVA